ncbi:TetR/AcrR family transcriptional regulator [Compostimonas suwonensis]|uniref:AcrR family transcriptional regulator n=1 Tax=Compostimonas suwonensis TaxID=1048394 RepID=A0A2M9BBB3_9MICO|nr:TetR/AcrR family transcriptional regulator [Compostimonas suwonensis]PJJ55223.1 AcrR family transcriptional regulator [Compostimonas suwonensis]
MESTLSSQEPTRGARDRILDAAAAVMREKGIAATTTKQIAQVAGYSEPMLYKHFADKQDLFMRVLEERMPQLQLPAELVGAATVAANLTLLVEQLLAFYVRSFPMAASIFGTPALLAAHRSGVTAHGGGPEAPVLIVQSYLDDEVELGRLPHDADTGSIARLLVGAAFQQAFFACFQGLDAVPHEKDVARTLVLAAVRGL